MDVVSSFDELLNNNSSEIVSDVSVFNYFDRQNVDSIDVRYNGRMVGVIEVERYEADPPELVAEDPEIYDQEDYYTVTLYPACDYGDGDYDFEYDGLIEPDAEFKDEREAKEFAVKYAESIEQDLAKGRNYYFSDEHLNRDYRRK